MRERKKKSRVLHKRNKETKEKPSISIRARPEKRALEDPSVAPTLGEAKDERSLSWEPRSSERRGAAVEARREHRCPCSAIDARLSRSRPTTTSTRLPFPPFFSFSPALSVFSRSAAAQRLLPRRRPTRTSTEDVHRPFLPPSFLLLRQRQRRQRRRRRRRRRRPSPARPPFALARPRPRPRPLQRPAAAHRHGGRPPLRAALPRGVGSGPPRFLLKGPPREQQQLRFSSSLLLLARRLLRPPPRAVEEPARPPLGLTRPPSRRVARGHHRRRRACCSRRKRRRQVRGRPPRRGARC